MPDQLQALSVSAFKELMEQDNVLVLDTRATNVFTQGYIPGSLFIGIKGGFAKWASALLPVDKTIILVTDEDKEEESADLLDELGFDKVAGYLEGGFNAWFDAKEKMDLVIDVEADELAMDIPFDENLLIVDVRTDEEFAEGHIKGALHVPLQDLTDPGSMAHFDEHLNIYLYCRSGYRSVIAATLIKQQGIHNIRNVVGGWLAIQELEDKFEFEKSEEKKE